MTSAQLRELMARYGGSSLLRDVMVAESMRERGESCTCRVPGESAWLDRDCPACLAADREVDAEEEDMYREDMEWRDAHE